jgi:hypothetical protein
MSSSTSEDVDQVDDQRRNQRRCNKLADKAQCCRWVDKAMAQMKEEQRIIKNAWLKMGFAWFNEEEGEGVLGVLEGVEGIV